MFGIGFASLKCKILLQDLISLNPDFVLAVMELDEIGKVPYMESCM